MNGGQDLGGMHGLGPVRAERNEPVFHAEWERRAFALTLAMGFTGQWNIDASRQARESLSPAEYLSKSYYEIWAAGLEKLLLERGLISDAEMVAGKAKAAPEKLNLILLATDVQKVLTRGGPAERETNTEPRYAVGDMVRARVMNPAGHTRLPRYARGRRGSIDRVHGCHVFPDSNAAGTGEAPQWLYSVCFNAQELWGEDAAAQDDVHVDLWESYLEPV